MQFPAGSEYIGHYSIKRQKIQTGYCGKCGGTKPEPLIDSCPASRDIPFSYSNCKSIQRCFRYIYHDRRGADDQEGKRIISSFI